MIGNLCEWCADDFYQTYEGYPVNGRALEKTGGDLRSCRGASWFSGPVFCSPRYRTRTKPDVSGRSQGFRPVRGLF